MDLYDKLNLLEEKINTILSESASLREENARLKSENDDLMTKLLVNEDELKQLNDIKEAARRRVEDLLARIG